MILNERSFSIAKIAVFDIFARRNVEIVNTSAICITFVISFENYRVKKKKKKPLHGGN